MSEELMKSDNLLSSFPSIENESHIAGKLDMMNAINARGVDQTIDYSENPRHAIRNFKRSTNK